MAQEAELPKPQLRYTRRLKIGCAGGWDAGNPCRVGCFGTYLTSNNASSRFGTKTGRNVNSADPLKPVQGYENEGRERKNFITAQAACKLSWFRLRCFSHCSEHLGTRNPSSPGDASRGRTSVSAQSSSQLYDCKCNLVPLRNIDHDYCG